MFESNCSTRSPVPRPRVTRDSEPGRPLHHLFRIGQVVRREQSFVVGILGGKKHARTEFGSQVPDGDGHGVPKVNRGVASSVVRWTH